MIKNTKLFIIFLLFFKLNLAYVAVAEMFYATEYTHDRTTFLCVLAPDDDYQAKFFCDENSASVLESSKLSQANFGFEEHLNRDCAGRNEICHQGSEPCSGYGTDVTACLNECSIRENCVSAEILSNNKCQLSTSCTLNESRTRTNNSILYIKRATLRWKQDMRYVLHHNGRNEAASFRIGPGANLNYDFSDVTTFNMRPFSSLFEGDYLHKRYVVIDGTACYLRMDSDNFDTTTNTAPATFVCGEPDDGGDPVVMGMISSEKGLPTEDLDFTTEAGINAIFRHYPIEDQCIPHNTYVRPKGVYINQTLLSNDACGIPTETRGVGENRVVVETGGHPTLSAAKEACRNNEHFCKGVEEKHNCEGEACFKTVSCSDGAIVGGRLIKYPQVRIPNSLTKDATSTFHDVSSSEGGEIFCSSDLQAGSPHLDTFRTCVKRNAITAEVWVSCKLSALEFDNIGLRTKAVNIGSNPQNVPGFVRMGVGEGDCDDDEDCQEGLYCHQRKPKGTTGLPIPGLELDGDQPADHDYCMLETSFDVVTAKNKGGNPQNVSGFVRMGVGEGDCDSDDHCQAGLICFQREQNQMVPGVSQDSLALVDRPKYDFCIKPEQQIMPEIDNIDACERQCNAEDDCRLIIFNTNDDICLLIRSSDEGLEAKLSTVAEQLIPLEGHIVRAKGFNLGFHVGDPVACFNSYSFPSLLITVRRFSQLNDQQIFERALLKAIIEDHVEYEHALRLAEDRLTTWIQSTPNLVEDPDEVRTKEFYTEAFKRYYRHKISCHGDGNPFLSLEFKYRLRASGNGEESTEETKIACNNLLALEDNVAAVSFGYQRDREQEPGAVCTKYRGRLVFDTAEEPKLYTINPSKLTSNDAYIQFARSTCSMTNFDFNIDTSNYAVPNKKKFKICTFEFFRLSCSSNYSCNFNTSLSALKTTLSALGDDDNPVDPEQIITEYGEIDFKEIPGDTDNSEFTEYSAYCSDRNEICHRSDCREDFNIKNRADCLATCRVMENCTSAEWSSLRGENGCSLLETCTTANNRSSWLAQFYIRLYVKENFDHLIQPADPYVYDVKPLFPERDCCCVNDGELDCNPGTDDDDVLDCTGDSILQCKKDSPLRVTVFTPKQPYDGTKFLVGKEDAEHEYLSVGQDLLSTLEIAEGSSIGDVSTNDLNFYGYPECNKGKVGGAVVDENFLQRRHEELAANTEEATPGELLEIRQQWAQAVSDVRACIMGSAYYKTIDPNDTKTTITDWFAANHIEESDVRAQVIYRNFYDLGFERRMYFAQNGSITDQDGVATPSESSLSSEDFESFFWVFNHDFFESQSFGRQGINDFNAGKYNETNGIEVVIMEFSKWLTAINLGKDGCSTNSPCGLGQGDCDEDSECLGELLCVERESGVPIPGLTIPSDLNAERPNHDFCMPDISDEKYADKYPYVKFYAYGGDGNRVPAANLDGGGAKPIPHVCLACHGAGETDGDTYKGRWHVNAATSRVSSWPGYNADGSGTLEMPDNGDMRTGFIMFDLATYKFHDEDGFRQAEQEDQFRKLNQGVLDWFYAEKFFRKQISEVELSKSVVSHDTQKNVIIGSYGSTGNEGRVELTGEFDDDYITPSWNDNEEIYLGFKFFCRNCHMMRRQGVTMDGFLYDSEMIKDDEFVNHLLDTDKGIMPYAKMGWQRLHTSPEINNLQYLLHEDEMREEYNEWCREAPRGVGYIGDKQKCSERGEELRYGTCNFNWLDEQRKFECQYEAQ